MPAVFLSRHMGLHTAYYAVISCILYVYPTVFHGRDNDLIIVICREADACPGHLRSSDQKLLCRAVPYPYGNRRLRQEYMLCRIETHEGKIICSIPSVLCLPADYQVLEKRVT